MFGISLSFSNVAVAEPLQCTTEESLSPVGFDNALAVRHGTATHILFRYDTQFAYTHNLCLIF